MRKGYYIVIGKDKRQKGDIIPHWRDAMVRGLEYCKSSGSSWFEVQHCYLKDKRTGRYKDTFIVNVHVPRKADMEWTPDQKYHIKSTHLM